jgi:hypothetical protein
METWTRRQSSANCGGAAGADPDAPQLKPSSRTRGDCPRRPAAMKQDVNRFLANALQLRPRGLPETGSTACDLPEDNGSTAASRPGPPRRIALQGMALFLRGCDRPPEAGPPAPVRDDGSRALSRLGTLALQSVGTCFLPAMVGRSGGPPGAQGGTPYRAAALRFGVPRRGGSRGPRGPSVLSWGAFGQTPVSRARPRHLRSAGPRPAAATPLDVTWRGSCT